MQKKKGISLIVLVMTIIVMIILAAAIILTLNNSGIINKANESVEVTDLAQVKHIATLKWSEAYLNKKISQTELYDAVIDGLTEAGINLANYVITVTEQGVDVAVIPNEWRENIIAVVDTVPIPRGFVASNATGENKKSSGLVIYEGEEAVTDANVETARRTRNQYVWVPVNSKDFTTKFVRQNFGMDDVLSNTLATDYWEVTLDLTANLPLTEQDVAYVTNTTQEGGITNTLAEVQAMYASVKEYGGFYIARYEAGIDTQRTSNDFVLETNVYSMMGKIPYTCINWGTSAMSNDTRGAVQVARSVYPVTNTEYGVISTLTYGVQWDTVLQWWLDTNAVASVTSTTKHGNYSDHKIDSQNDLNGEALVWDYTASATGSYVTKDSATLTYPKATGTCWQLSTGALKAANVNNIYDMAGNVYEWTMEGYSTRSHVYRGGWFRGKGTENGCPAAERVSNYPSNGNYAFGLRFALYIKK